MQSNDIKRWQDYINRKNGRPLRVEDYFEGLVVYHYLDNPGKTQQASEQYFCKNMVRQSASY